MLGRDLQENDVLVHNPVVPDVQFQGRWHEVRFFCEVDGSAVHALGRARLVKRGDEGCEINGVLVPLFKSNAPPFPPDEHKCQRNEPDDAMEPSLPRESYERWLIRK